MGLAGELLERAARAWPVTDERWLDGWWLRHTDSEPWWSGAVLAHADGGGLEGLLAAAERFYAEHGDWPRFQVCPDCPPDLDLLLHARGYAAECAVVLMTGRAPACSAGARDPAVDVRVEPGPDAAWVAARRATSHPAPDPAHLAQRLATVTAPQAFVTVMGPDRPLGIGRAVADTGWTGVFDMATLPGSRRRGIARAVLGAITRWAVDQATPRMYLQVEEPNTTALALYRNTGFAVTADYHYRSLRLRPTAPLGDRTHSP